jgi:hypothetical protein
MDRYNIRSDGILIAHQVGDLVRIRNKRSRFIDYPTTIDYSGKLGMIVDTSESEAQMILPFIHILVFSTNELRCFAPHEIEIISNNEK